MTTPGSATSRLLVAGLVIIAAGAGGFALYRMAQTPASVLAPETATVSMPEPEAASTPHADPPARTIPETLPEITLANLEGKPTRLASFGGRPLMVNFWATWCAPCRREIPLLNRLRAERKPQNAEIVGIAVDFREDVLAFVQKVPLEYPLLMGEEDGMAAAAAFGMTLALPFSVFIDSQNRILTIKVGELHEDEANFAFDRLRDIDRGILTLKMAQAQVAEAFAAMAVERAKSEAAHPKHGENDAD